MSVGPAPAARPTVAVWKFSSCDGCQLSLLDCEDELLAVAEQVRIAYFLEATRATVEGPYDLSLVEGSVTTAHDAERIREIRAASRRLVTIGACATAGGIQALRNHADIDEYVHASCTPRPATSRRLATSTPISAHVPVDFELRGCPIDRRQLLDVIAAFLGERRPNVAGHSVCVECKLRGNVCVMVADGTPCLGPVTHAGCGALCPTYHRGCYGCFGPAEDPNPASLTSQLDRLGVERVDLVRMLRTFNVDAAPFRDESARLDAGRLAVTAPDGERTLRVDALARVEGEGAMDVVIRDGILRSVQLRIYEPPRFFEAMLRGRAYTEPPDITARICGICPVAYQMSACNAIEALCGVTVDGPLADLRRLLYCGEWIESHTLHIYLLHAPDFLGYDGVIDLAADHRDVVQRGLELKKIGNELVELIGGRAIHPVNVRVGGFYRVPTERELARFAPRLERARDLALDTVRWVAGFDFPDHEWLGELAALAHPGRVPDHAGPARLHARPRHRPRGRSSTTWSRSTSSTRPRCTPGSSTGASTCSARWPASPSTPTSCPRWPRMRRRRQGCPPASATRSDRSSSAPSRCCTPVTRRSGSSTVYRRARRGRRRGRGPRRGRLRLDRGAPRDAVAPVRVRRRRLDHQRPDRAADLAEPGRHRARPVPLRRAPPRPRRRRARPPCRAGHPQLRPVHLVRDALPRPDRRPHVTSPRRGDRRRQPVPARRRRGLGRGGRRPGGASARRSRSGSATASPPDSSTRGPASSSRSWSTRCAAARSPARSASWRPTGSPSSRRRPAPVGSHSLGIGQALALGRALGRLPGSTRRHRPRRPRSRLR